MKTDALINFTCQHSDGWGTGLILQDPTTKKFLLGRRVDTKEWASPGGKCEMGENPIQAVIRECKEESNVTVNSLKHYDTLLHQSPATNKSWVSFLFYSDDYDDTDLVGQKEELVDLQYYTLNEVFNLDLFPPTEASFIKLRVILGNQTMQEEIPYVDMPSTPSRVSSDVNNAYSFIGLTPTIF